MTQKNDRFSSPEFSPEEPTHSPVGAIIGSVVLFILIIIGVLYVYGNQLKNHQTLETREENAEGEVIINNTAEQDELDILEEELDALGSFDYIGAELESELEAEFGE
jgi:hypothetical protein